MHKWIYLFHTELNPCLLARLADSSSLFTRVRISFDSISNLKSKYMQITPLCIHTRQMPNYIYLFQTDLNACLLAWSSRWFVIALRASPNQLRLYFKLNKIDSRYQTFVFQLFVQKKMENTLSTYYREIGIKIIKIFYRLKF